MPVLNTADKLYLGTTLVDAVYLGTTKVWPTVVSAFDPTHIAGLAGWYDASQLTLADGAVVFPWPDLSGNNRHLTLNPGNSTFTSPACKTNGLNGKRVVRYATNGTNVSTHMGSGGATYGHFFLVATFAANAFPEYNGLLTGIADDTYLLIGTAGSTVWYPSGGGGTGLEYRLNGVVDATRAAPMQTWAQLGLTRDQPYTSFSLQIGLDRIYPPRYWFGDVAEVIAYDHRLADAERIQIENYLSDKWLAPPFAPTQIAGLAVWLDASQLALADGAAVSSWPDLSGQGHTGAIVGTPGPAVRANALKGQRVVRFKPNEGRVRGNTGLSAGGIDTYNFTVIYITRAMAGTVGRAFSGLYPQTNYTQGFHSSGQDLLYCNGWVKNASAWGTFPTPWKLYTATSSHDGTANLVRFYSNSVDLTENTAAAGAGGLGSGYNLSGYDATSAVETMDCEVAELVIYNRKLSDAERVQVEDYLRGKWLA